MLSMLPTAGLGGFIIWVIVLIILLVSGRLGPY